MTEGECVGGKVCRWLGVYQARPTWWREYSFLSCLVTVKKFRLSFTRGAMSGSSAARSEKATTFIYPCYSPSCGSFNLTGSVRCDVRCFLASYLLTSAGNVLSCDVTPSSCWCVSCDVRGPSTYQVLFGNCWRTSRTGSSSLPCIFYRPSG